jgi:voltage-gated potassium channel
VAGSGLSSPDLPSASLRRRTYLALNPQSALTHTARLLILVIIAATLVTVVETEASATRGNEALFLGSRNLFHGRLRAGIWRAHLVGLRRPMLAAALRAELRFAGRPGRGAGLGADLLAPSSCCCACCGWCGCAKLARYSPALAMMRRAVRARASHLLVSLSLALVFLLISATIMYGIEGEAQPEQFGSIPTGLVVERGDDDHRRLWRCGPPFDLRPPVRGDHRARAASCWSPSPTGIMAAAFSDELLDQREGRAPEINRSDD